MKRIAFSSVQPFETDHIAVVRKVAPECMVLLKYDGSFPVKPGKIAAFGNGVRHTVKGGEGSGDVNVRSFSNVEQGLQNAGFTLTSTAWLDSYDKVYTKAHADFDAYLQNVAAESNEALSTFGLLMPEPEYELPLEAEGNTAIYVLTRTSGEGADRKPIAGDLYLTETEKKDILALASRFEKFMLVLNVGGMVDLTPIQNSIKNILVMSQLGSPTGDALADVLCGKAYPSGKLTMTWAPIANYPSTVNFGSKNDTCYTEGIFVGYRYFDTFAADYSFPFGFGLGYTTFTYETLSFSADSKNISVYVEVTNTGKTIGKEVIQVYFSAPDGKMAKPAKELAAYIKTRELSPGEKQRLNLVFPLVQMSSYDVSQAAYILEPGIYEILVGTSSANVVSCGKVLLENEVITQQLRNVGGISEFTDISPSKPKATVSAEGAIRLDTAKIVTKTTTYCSEPTELTGKRGTWEEVKRGILPLAEFVGGLTDDQLAHLCIGNYRDSKKSKNIFDIIGNASSRIAGAAGETTDYLKELGIPSLTMPDGPAGLRLSTEYVLRNDSAVPLYSSLAPNTRKKIFPGETIYYQYCVAIPIGTALAQAWDTEIPRICGDLVGEEMELFGANLWLAPAMNILRNPQCGRNFEYYSEDPFVTGMTAAALTEGVQAHSGCSTTIKHFCCNNQETNRMHSNSILSERALREIYLRGFELCVSKAHPHCVMSSYNLVNGEHANSRRCLLTWVLRDEWGFDGFVMIDWLTTVDLSGTEQKYGIASPANCIKSGNDMIMPGVSMDYDGIMEALNNPHHPTPLTRAHLQQSALRILKVILLLAP